MAFERWFTGFESGGLLTDFSATAPTVGYDGTARTGDFYWRVYAPTSTVNTGDLTHDLSHAYTCAAAEDQVVARMQVAFRLYQHSSASGVPLFGFGKGGNNFPNQDGMIAQDASTGELTFIGNNVTTTGTGFVPTLGVWYVARLEFRYQRKATTNDVMSITLQVYLGEAVDSEGAVPVAAATWSGTPNLSGFILIPPSLGTVSNVRRIADFDDLWVACADGVDAEGTLNPGMAWPAGSRIQAVPITGQGPEAQWTNDWLYCRDIPLSSTAGFEQTATGAGLRTTFLHDTAATLGLIPDGQLAQAGSSEEQAEAPPFSGGELGSPAYTNWLEQDAALPLPTLSYTAPAGTGSFTGGVWVQAYTLRYTWTPSVGGSTQSGYHIGPRTAAVWVSASDFPNFALTATVTLNAATPADSLLAPNPSAPNVAGYTRYGVGLLVTNAYNNSGIFTPYGNTTNLRTQGGPTVNVQTNGFGSLVALYSFLVRTDAPYPNTNPAGRPSVYTFTLAQPSGGFTGQGSTANAQGWTVATRVFIPFFEYPSQVQDSVFPVAAAVKVYAALKRSSGSGTDNILIDGVATGVPTDTGYDNLYAFDWTPRTAAEFDALTFGAETGSGTATQLGNCVAEVLTAGPCTRRSPGTGQYQQACGVYTANNTYQQITVGFRPSAVILKKLGSSGTSPGSFKAWWMGGTMSFPIGTLGGDSVGIMDLNDTGFLVGPSTNANTDSAIYAYVAIKDGNEDTVNDAYMTTGMYWRQETGDALTTVTLGVPDIFEPDWVPDVVLVFGSATVLLTPDMVAPNADVFTTTGLATNAITATGAGTFDTGTNTAVGSIGRYPYIAFRFDDAGLLASVFQYGAFAGTGGAQVIPTNFQGEVIVLDHPNASYNGRFRSFSGNTGNNSTPWVGGAATTTDITAIGAADFTVGTGASVSGQTSYWLAWKVDGAFGNTGSTTLPPGPGGGDNPDPPPGSPGNCAGGGLKLSNGSPNGQGCVQCAPWQ